MSQPMRHPSHDSVPPIPASDRPYVFAQAMGPARHARALQQQLAQSVAQAVEAPGGRLSLGMRVLLIAVLASVLWAAIGATVWTVLR